MKPLVDYPDDEEETEEADMQAFYDAHDAPPELDGEDEGDDDLHADSVSLSNHTTPPERLAEKRRREEDDDDDELGKLTVHKRRTSASGAPTDAKLEVGGKILRRRPNLASNKDGVAKKIAISLGTKTAGEVGPGGGDDDGVD